MDSWASKLGQTTLVVVWTSVIAMFLLYLKIKAKRKEGIMDLVHI